MDRARERMVLHTRQLRLRQLITQARIRIPTITVIIRTTGDPVSLSIMALATGGVDVTIMDILTGVVDIIKADTIMAVRSATRRAALQCTPAEFTAKPEANRLRFTPAIQVAG